MPIENSSSSSPPPDIASRPTLLSIPVETFERIAQLADPKDLLALRLTCHEAADKVLRTYTQCHFTEHSLLLTEEHLNTAIDVASHPVFGESLHTIRICIDEVDYEGRFPGMHQVYVSGTRVPEPCQELVDARAKQRRFRESRLDLALLNTLFGKLRMARRTEETMMSVVMFDQWQGHCPLPPHLAQEFRPPPMDHDWPFHLVMEAIGLSAIRIQSLRLEMCDWSLPVHNLISDSLGIGTLAQLHSVRHLQLDIWHDIEFYQEYAKAFMGFLSGLPFLTYLSLNIKVETELDEEFNDAWIDLFYLSDWLMKQDFPFLKHLEVTGGNFNFSNLVGFLSRAAHTSGLSTVRAKNLKVQSRHDEPEESIEESLRRLTAIPDVVCEECNDYF